jgi:hypothetical protein
MDTGRCRVWLGRGAKRAKRTQFGGRGPHDCGSEVADWKMPAGADAGGQMRKTKPISPGRRVNAQDKPNFWQRRKKSGGDAQPTKGRSVQNEPNLARAPGNGRGLAGRDARPEGDCTKRSQFRRRLPSAGADGSARRPGTPIAIHRDWEGLPPAKQSGWGPEPTLALRRGTGPPPNAGCRGEAGARELAIAWPEPDGIIGCSEG